jgi:hypothetical protein
VLSTSLKNECTDGTDGDWSIKGVRRMVSLRPNGAGHGRHHFTTLGFGDMHLDVHVSVVRGV